MAYIVVYEEKDNKGSDNVIFDTIWQKEENGQLNFDEKKMNKYSQALKIEQGFVFEGINEWLEYIVGKNLVVCIRQDKEKGKDYISYYRSVKQDDTLKDGEVQVKILSAKLVEYQYNGETRLRVLITLDKLYADFVEPQSINDDDLPF